MKIDTNQAKFESIQLSPDEGLYDSKNYESIQQGKKQDKKKTMIHIKTRLIRFMMIRFINS